jgi:hypothetical protein
MVVPGFPNLLLMLGPNTGTGHTSTLLYIEPQARYALACLQHLRRTGGRWMDLRPGVMETEDAALQARLAGSVWSQCRSWYRADNGRIVALWPGFTDEYVRGIERPDFSRYAFG